MFYTSSEHSHKIREVFRTHRNFYLAFVNSQSHSRTIVDVHKHPWQLCDLISTARLFALKARYSVFASVLHINSSTDAAAVMKTDRWACAWKCAASLPPFVDTFREQATRVTSTLILLYRTLQLC